ncbi:MAG TPA: putative LPS assembly protein LptD, partial [Bacteroidota bacterium]|nr:putative LPS assembly protein LptD [Bacteroidota bacterium]
MPEYSALPDWYCNSILPDRMILRFRIAIVVLALVACWSTGQSQSQDTLRNIPPPLPRDTTAAPANAGVDTVVNYSATDSIVYNIQTKFMHLYGKTDLQYQTLGLKAEQTTVNWNTMTLTAQGVKDSTDTTGTKSIGLPVLKDGGDVYNGSRVAYNFRSKKGKIDVGATEMDKGYYHGDEVKKVDQNVLFVENGRFTTCDEKDPHFYFASPRMKVLVRDKVIAEPVYFYVADVPVFVLPFGVFPSRGGRSSGIIAPAYGEDSRKGKYLSHFGYFWAASDYWDVGTTFDWFARGGWMNRTNIRYNLRYNFSGALNTNITHFFTGEPGDPDYTTQRDYNINWTHHQNINPSTQLDVNFTWMTGSYFQNFSNDLSAILLQNMVSTATFTKSWDESNSRLSVYAYRDQNLKTGSVNEQLPSFSFSQGQIFPFKPKTKSRGLESGSSEDAPWYELISLSYGGQGANNHARTVQAITSSHDTTVDSRHYGINHNIVVNMAPKLGHFTLTPSFNYNEKWYIQRTEFDSLGRSHDYGGFRAVRTYNLG